MRSESILKVLDSIICVLESLPIKKRLVHGGFAEKAILECRTVLFWIEGREVDPIVDLLFVREP